MSAASGGRGRGEREGRVAWPQAVIVTSGPAGFRRRSLLGTLGEGAPQCWGSDASAAPRIPVPSLPSAVLLHEYPGGTAL